MSMPSTRAGLGFSSEVSRKRIRPPKSGQNSVPREVLERLEAAADQLAYRHTVAEPGPAGRVGQTPRSGQVRPCPPVEKLLRPLRRGPDAPNRLARTHGTIEVTDRVVERGRVIREVGHYRRAVERHEPRSLPDRNVQHRHVGVPHEDLRIPSDQAEVEVR